MVFSSEKRLAKHAMGLQPPQFILLELLGHTRQIEHA